MVVVLRDRRTLIRVTRIVRTRVLVPIVVVKPVRTAIVKNIHRTVFRTVVIHDEHEEPDPDNVVRAAEPRCEPAERAPDAPDEKQVRTVQATVPPREDPPPVRHAVSHRSGATFQPDPPPRHDSTRRVTRVTQTRAKPARSVPNVASPQPPRARPAPAPTADRRVPPVRTPRTPRTPRG